jgi:DNA-binding PucR family transcriptional regulator
VTLIAEHGTAADQDGFVESTRSALQTILESDLGRGLAAVISSSCRRSDDLARAHMECRQLMQCVLELCPEDSPPLAASDLGVGRLLLGSSDAFAMNRFATAALGSLLVDDERHQELLTTLHVFLESGRSPRNAGRALYVHENTVRYRLARVYELTGLDVSADLNDQLTAQVALLILRLQGRLPDVDFYGRLVRFSAPEGRLAAAGGALAAI